MMQDVLDMLSTKILEGWTVLDEQVRIFPSSSSITFSTRTQNKIQCPMHRDDDISVPLLMREQRLYCGMCNMYCIREKDFDETKHRMWSGEKNETPSPPRPPLSSTTTLSSETKKYHYYSPPKPSNSPTVDNVMALMTELRHQHITKGQIYNFMDEYRNDRVTLREFKRGLEQIGITTTHREALKMFHDIDKNRDGRISWREFEDAYMSSLDENVRLSL